MRINTTIEYGEASYEVSFDVENVEKDRDGIGAYEYWGFKGFDRGKEFVSDFDIENLQIFENGVEVNAPLGIEDAIKDNEDVFSMINDLYFDREN